MAKKKEKEPVDPNAPPPAKQSAGVYTMLLIISFIALFIGCVLLYLEMQRYDFKYKPEPGDLVPVTQLETPAPMVASFYC